MYLCNSHTIPLFDLQSTITHCLKTQSETSASTRVDILAAAKSSASLAIPPKVEVEEPSVVDASPVLVVRVETVVHPPPGVVVCVETVVDTVVVLTSQEQSWLQASSPQTHTVPVTFSLYKKDNETTQRSLFFSHTLMRLRHPSRTGISG